MRLAALPIALLAAGGAAAALPAGAPGPAERAALREPARVVLFPFSDVSGAPGARGGVMPALAGALRSRGWSVVEGDAVERALEAGRVRWLASPSPDELAAVLAALGAERAVLGTVLAYAEGPPPAVAVTARLVSRDGALLWSDTASLSGDDLAGLLGIGRTRVPGKVARAAAARLADTMPSPDGRAGPRRPGSPRALPSRRSGRRPVPGLAAVRGACVLPFEDESGDGSAARIVGELVARRLRAQARIPVIEPAALRAAMAAEGIQTFRMLDGEALRRLGRRLGADVIVQGIVYRFADQPGARGGTDPAVEVHLSMVSAADGRLLWGEHLARRGSDYLQLLQRGAIGDRVSLADQVVAELVDGLSP